MGCIPYFFVRSVDRDDDPETFDLEVRAIPKREEKHLDVDRVCIGQDKKTEKTAVAQGMYEMPSKPLSKSFTRLLTFRFLFTAHV
jgi:hypothetical protein